MENLEKQIVRIIEDNSPELAAEEVLRLFSVVGRIEQLKAFILDYVKEFEENGTTGIERYMDAKELLKSL
jgi:hypothetical protein